MLAMHRLQEEKTLLYTQFIPAIFCRHVVFNKNSRLVSEMWFVQLILSIDVAIFLDFSIQSVMSTDKASAPSCRMAEVALKWRVSPTAAIWSCFFCCDQQLYSSLCRCTPYGMNQTIYLMKTLPQFTNLNLVVGHLLSQLVRRLDSDIYCDLYCYKW